MARIFSMFFEFENETFHTVVTVHTTPFFTEFRINIPNDRLRALLPGNKIISTSPFHYEFQHANKENSLPLMNEIIRVVSQHMQTTKA
jgi:hypothetical protein